MNKNFVIKIFYSSSIILILFHLIIIAGCNVSPTVILPPVTGYVVIQDTGTLYPMIQRVYPGTLQSLDIPQSYPTNISPENPGIAVIFSHEMINDNNEMETIFELVESGSSEPSAAIIVSPSISSKYFLISPLTGPLNEDTEYTLRIYKFAAAKTELMSSSVSRNNNIAFITTQLNHSLNNNELVTISSFTDTSFNTNTALAAITVIDENNFSFENTGPNITAIADTAGVISVYSRTLVFDNLVSPPAETISPADPLYVEYRFRTGRSAAEDYIPPSIAYINPPDGATNVIPDPLAGNGYIEIVFYDDRIPMIDPSTVNDKSIILHDLTADFQINGIVDFIQTDTDYKTFRFYPNWTSLPSWPRPPDPLPAYLDSNTAYRLRISPDNFQVTDFAGNRVHQTDIYFSTGEM